MLSARVGEATDTGLGLVSPDRTPPGVLGDPAIDLLAQRARGGDRNARARLCEACSRPLERYFHRALGSSQEAEEATQQVLMQMLSALPHYREQGTPFRAFVFRLAHNYGLDRNASRARMHPTDPDDVAHLQEAAQEPAQTPWPAERRDSLDTLLAPLTPIQQRVIRLLYEHDLTPAQAGVVVGCTASGVRQLHKRARDALRDIVLMQSNG